MLVFMIIAAILLGLLVNAVIVARWLPTVTQRDAYFSLPIAERRALREKIRRRGRLATPILSLILPPFRKRFFLMKKYQGLTAPGALCSPETFASAQHYRPQPEDVFVATQMKCGTTWMQQIVYESVCRGKGNLGDDGHRHMYATSPWIESTGSVSMENAPLVGERPTRIIKTHLPATLCPYDEKAHYIYVLRHPVSCYASCIDFLRSGLGPIAPNRDGILDWFCSDDMWWGPWADHAEGWWGWRDRENVLFLHYEDMKTDLGAAVKQVSDFLGLDLDEKELTAVTEKSDYRWMKEREEWFEMHAPSIFSVHGAFFNSGSRERHKDATDVETERICRFTRERLAGGDYPLARFYPDVANG